MKKNSFRKNSHLILFLFLITLKGIAQPLVVDPGLSQTICSGSSTTIGGSPTANYGTPGYTYSWAPATGLSSTTVSNPIANPTATTTYTITVTDALPTVLTATVTVTVTPLPTVGALLSPFVCYGTTIATTNFISSPGGAAFNWTNSNTAIGLAASGSGNVPSFTATNSGSTVIGGNISVTATLDGCTGPPTNYTITVKPKPVATSSPLSDTRCSGVNSNFVLTSTVAGTTFSWTTSGSGVSGNTAGSGTVISQAVSATGNVPGTANYFVTPVASGCAGGVISPVLTVNPIPVATATTSPLVRCSGDTASFSVTSNVSGTTFTWSSFATNTAGADASGVGTYVFDTLTATTSAAGTMTYLFTPVAAGCTGSPAFPYVTVNPFPDPNFSYSSSGCQFSPNALPSFSAGASAGTFTSFPAGMIINPSTGEIDLTTSTPNSYLVTNTIAAAGGCPSVNANNGFTITAYQDPTITAVTPVCISSPPFYLSAASTGGTWSGPGIVNTLTGQFDPGNSGSGTFNITYTTPTPCLNVDTVAITVMDNDIYGKVTYSGGDLVSGTNYAVLYNYSAIFSTFDTVQVSSVDAVGYYHFTSVPTGEYLIEIFADTLVYPLAVPTYYGSEFLWDSALVKIHGCSTDTADVYVIEGITTSGPGMLSGTVTEGAGFVRIPGDPIPGLDVKLGKNPGGAMITSTQTNPLGGFAFSNIPINSPGEYYTVYVDIPGLQRDSVYNVTVTASNFIYTQLNYEADSNSVYPIPTVVTQFSNSEMNNNDFVVYPNPTSSISNIEYVLKSSSLVTLEVVDILGQQVQLLEHTTHSAGKHKVNLQKLDAGIYFIKLNINNQTNTIRLVVTD